MGLALLALMDSPFEVFPHPGLGSSGSGLGAEENDLNPLRSVQHS